MANEQNLIPNKNRTPEELRAMTRKGGIASGVARRAKKEAREIARQVLDQHPEMAQELAQKYQRFGMKKNFKPDVRYVATMAIARKAVANGDVRAYDFLIQLAGEDNKTAKKGNSEPDTQGVVQDEQYTQMELDSDAVRQRMAQMTDEELEQYERMCALFEGVGGGEDG